MIRIAIDGPGGAGKSTLSKAVAKELGIIYVDTGALYRTIGLYILNHGVDPKDRDGVVARLNDFTLELTFTDGKQTILLDGCDVGDSIRTPEVSMAASAVSAIPAVREYLLNMQRSTARKNSVIMDGRDIGTVILPNAEVKIFLTASPKARAQRRYDELIAKGQSVTYEQVYNEMVERDTNDSTRAVAPLKPADDAIIVDNSDLTFDQLVKAILKIIKKREKKLSKRNGYMKLHFLVAPMIRFFQRVTVTGVENIPTEGGYVLCSNHIAVRDVILLGASSPRQLKFIGKKELFSIPILGSILKWLGAIRLDRGGADVGALKAAVSQVERGSIVAIFPQGHRRPGVNPAETETKNGAALIAYRSYADIIPACIKTTKNKFTFMCKKEIIFGKPIKYSDLGFVKGGKSEYKKATDIIFSEILKLGDFPALPEPDAEKTND
ncbi:MAG: (d)CMP kinase [Clostridia bacterium]|nr:(d)CMP kinase [Clostridia bacterium]